MNIYEEQNKWSSAIDSLNETKSFSIDIFGSTLDVEGLKGTFYIDVDGWDKTSRRFDDMKALSINRNDPWIDDIDNALEEYGLELDTDRKHIIANLDDGEMILHLRKIMR